MTSPRNERRCHPERSEGSGRGLRVTRTPWTAGELKFADSARANGGSRALHRSAFIATHPPGSRGMDLYIGEPDRLGAGHGSALVRQHVEALFARGAPAVGIDPHPDNAGARRAFEKAGFRFVRGPTETPWGLAVLMERRRDRG